MRSISFYFLPVVLCCLLGCGTPTETTAGAEGTQAADISQPKIDDSHNSRNALDWSGTYSGTPPRPDGRDIITTLRIYDTQQFTLTTEKPGVVASVSTTGGYFDWRPDGVTIQINGYDPETTPTFFLIGENQLFMLPLDGQREDGDLTDESRMPRVEESLTGTTWRLKTIRGRTDGLQKMKPPTLVLDDNDDKVKGMGGCNQFSGTYTEDQNRLAFPPMMSTKMACPDMSIESAYQTALSQVGRYRQLPGTLILMNDNFEEVLRFNAG